MAHLALLGWLIAGRNDTLDLTNDSPVSAGRRLGSRHRITPVRASPRQRATSPLPGRLRTPGDSPTVKSDKAGSNEAAAGSQKIRPRRVDTARADLQLG